MSWPDVYTTRIEAIRHSAASLAENSTMLASFRCHRPAFYHGQIVSAARDLRRAADELDRLAERMMPEGTDYPDQFVAAG